MLRLCYIVADFEPLGANEWVVVASRFEYGRVEDEPYRDHDSLRKKFDNLAGSKKKKGDPSCTEEVRQAKHAKWDI